MLLANKLRKEKILTESLLAELIRELAPCTYIKTNDTPAIVKITDQTGLQTSHYMLSDLLDNTYKDLIDALPEDIIVPVGPVYTFSYESEVPDTAPEDKIVRAMADGDYTLVAEDIPTLTDESGAKTFKNWTLNGQVVAPGVIITGNAHFVAVWE